jgi:hypothetical protein
MKVAYALILLSTLLACACYQPRQGCLDPNGVNFDVNADRDTGCIYPVLRLNVAHLHGGSGIKFDSTYTNSLNQRYKILDFAYYLSGYEFDQGLKTSGVLDTFQAYKYQTTPDDSLKVTPIRDFALLRRNTIDYAIGSFREVGQFETVRMNFGLGGALQGILPGSVVASNLLAPQAEMLFDSTNHRHYFGRLVIEHEVNNVVKVDTLRLRAEDFSPLDQEIEQQIVLKQRAGFNFIIKLNVNYQNWFNKVDLSLGKRVIEQEMAKSVKTSFLFEQ